MNKDKLEAFAREAAKGLKTEKDLNEFSQMLTKVAVEAAICIAKRRCNSRAGSAAHQNQFKSSLCRFLILFEKSSATFAI